MFREGSSPHTRGALGAAHVERGGEGIIPAYAGSTSTSTNLCDPLPDHPRIRGEHDMKRNDVHRWVGSSPHTRGALLVDLVAKQELRIIPAYAGSTK